MTYITPSSKFTLLAASFDQTNPLLMKHVKDVKRGALYIFKQKVCEKFVLRQNIEKNTQYSCVCDRRKDWCDDLVMEQGFEEI